MKTGVSYVGHHNPQHMETDMREMKQLRIEDVSHDLQTTYHCAYGRPNAV